MPAYQSDAPLALGVINSYSSAQPCGAPTGYCREVPDVSADADPITGLVIDWGPWGGWTVVGGTSLAAPLWAALVALTDAWPACSAHPVGFLNPALYLIAGRRVRERLERRHERQQPLGFDSQLVALPGYGRI